MGNVLLMGQAPFTCLVYIPEKELAVRLNIQGYRFIAPGTSLLLVVHRVVYRDVHSEQLMVSDKHWVVSEPTTGLRLIHEREFVTRRAAMEEAAEVLARQGMDKTMESIMLNTPRTMDAPLYQFKDGYLVAAD